jgi:outer membrane protein OmpA-like peptidoglycan-associated protein
MDKQQAELRRELAGTGVNVERQGDNIVLQMPGDVTFDTNRYEIKPQFYTVLNDVAGTLNKYPQTTVDVVGHADSTGAADYNQGLSERRAGSVAEYLVTAGGVMRERLAVAGKGSTAPLADNATPDGRAKNRRVEIVLKPITS